VESLVTGQKTVQKDVELVFEAGNALNVVNEDILQGNAVQIEHHMRDISLEVDHEADIIKEEVGITIRIGIEAIAEAEGIYV